jgi:c-di-GMP-binding flagellar brake protein YcgR
MFRGVLVGLEPGEYLLVKTAIPREFESAILPGIHFNITYHSQGLDFGFTSTLIETIERPYRLTFLSYPATVDSIDVRSQSRICCYIPSSAFLNNNTIKGIVTDISPNGCRFVIRLPFNLQARQILLIDSIILQFPVFGLKGLQTFNGVVRNTSVDREKIAMGIEFREMNKEISDSLGEYITSVTELNISE